MSKPKTFHLDTTSLELPRGAYAGGTRHILSFGGKPVAAFTQGKFRPYIHPVWTPDGIVVTAEGPVDHPHHSGIWCAADHVASLHDGPDGIERYDYCFYVNEVFQGRAPGLIRMSGIKLQAVSHDQATVRQEMQWVSPREWGVPDGHIVMFETRTTTISCADQAYVFDVSSELRAGESPIEIGPTRHAYFNARVCDALALSTIACQLMIVAARVLLQSANLTWAGWIFAATSAKAQSQAWRQFRHRKPCETGLWLTGEWQALGRSGTIRHISQMTRRCCFDAVSSRMTDHCRMPRSTATHRTSTRHNTEFRHANCPLPYS